MSYDNAELDRLMDDPVRNHTKIMQMLRPTLSTIVHKDFHGRQPAISDDTSDNEPALDDRIDLLLDAVSQALAQTRIELRAEFEDIVENAVGSLADDIAMLQSQTAVLQGQVGVLMNLISGIVGNNNGNGNGNGSKSIEASEVRTTRRVRVRRTNETSQ